MLPVPRAADGQRRQHGIVVGERGREGRRLRPHQLALADLGVACGLRSEERQHRVLPRRRGGRRELQDSQRRLGRGLRPGLQPDGRARRNDDRLDAHRLDRLHSGGRPVRLERLHVGAGNDVLADRSRDRPRRRCQRNRGGDADLRERLQPPDRRCADRQRDRGIGRRQLELRHRRQLHDRDAHGLRREPVRQRIRSRLVDARPHQRSLQLARHLRLLRLPVDDYRQPRSERPFDRVLQVHPDRHATASGTRSRSSRRSRSTPPTRPPRRSLLRARPAGPITRARVRACTSSRTPPTAASTSRPPRATATPVSPRTASPAGSALGTNWSGSGSGSSRTYSYTATATTNGSQNVSATNNAGRSASSSFDLTLDSTAPTGGALTVNETAASGGGTTSYDGDGNFTIATRTDYSESQTSSASGLASSTLVRTSASFSASDVCGAFGSPSTITGNPDQNGLSTGCYRYTLTGTRQRRERCFHRHDRQGGHVGSERSVTHAGECDRRRVLLGLRHARLLQARRGQRRLRRDRELDRQRHGRRFLHVPRRAQASVPTGRAPAPARRGPIATPRRRRRTAPRT